MILNENAFPVIKEAMKILQREIDLKEIDMVTGRRITEYPNPPKHEMGQ